MKAESARTTITLPKDLLEAVDRAVSAGLARSRNDLVAEVLRRLLAEEQRVAIDATFSGMDDDTMYLDESSALERGFDQSSWEVLRRAEQP